MAKLGKTVPAREKHLAKYLLVNVGNDCCGIDISYVKNVVRIPDITRVPKAQPYFKGIINLRGEIIAVMDLCFRVAAVRRPDRGGKSAGELKEDLFTDDSRIVILNIGEFGDIGMIVDKVNGMAVLAEEEIDHSRKPQGNMEAEYVAGIATYEKRDVFLLNIKAAACGLADKRKDGGE